MNPPNLSIEQDVQLVDTLSIISYPGGGKGTNMKHIQSLLEDHGRAYEYFEVGAMVRNHFRNKTPTAQLFKEHTPPGGLVPDHIIVPEIANGIAQLKQECAWLFDGYPRNVPQVSSYVENIERFERNDLILYLQLDKDPKVAAEIADRRIAIRVEEIIAKGEIPREDDADPKARKERLIVATELYEVVDQLRARFKNIHVIDASRPKDPVASDISEVIRPHMLRAA